MSGLIDRLVKIGQMRLKSNVILDLRKREKLWYLLKSEEASSLSSNRKTSFWSPSKKVTSASPEKM